MLCLTIKGATYGRSKKWTMRSGYRRSGLTDQSDLELVPAGSHINFVAFSWEFLGKEKDLKDFSFLL